MIPEPHTLALFAVAAFLLAVVPGPAVVYIVTQSIDGGRVAGLASAAGIGTGGLVHVMFAAVGLSALLLRSAVAFEVVKYAGAAYLIVMGIRRLMEKDVEPDPDVIHERSLWRLYRQGVVVNVLNPKTALFFFAFLPQFVNPDAGRVGVQIAHPRPRVRRGRDDQRLDVRARRRNRGTLAEGEPRLPARAALGVRHGLHRARRRDGALGLETQHRVNPP